MGLQHDVERRRLGRLFHLLFVDCHQDLLPLP